MDIDLGGLDLDVGLALRQLRQDLRDDWFPDPRQFEDIFKGDHIQTVVNQNFQANHGEYKPLGRDLFNIPKSNFTLRYALETGIADRVLYQAIAASLIGFFDPLLPWQVFNHRKCMGRSSGKYLFNYAIESWQNFIGAVQVGLKELPALLSTDVANYYDNIDIPILQQTMIDRISTIQASATEKARIRLNLEKLFLWLGDWSHTPLKGLPQNRDASSFLANIYMLPIDEEMIAAGFRYFRYMDDVKVVCRDEFEARKALKALTVAIRARGLSLNSGKTIICAPGEDEKIANCLDTGGPELQRLATIWSSKAIRPISRSFPILKSLTIQFLEAGQVDKKAFRFCINRLEVLARCQEFAVPAEYFAEITPLVIRALTRNPSASDRLIQYLRSVELNLADYDGISGLLQDPRRCIYNWQNWLLWTLLVQKEHKEPGLLTHALDIVRGGQDNANRSGAVLYAGALGSYTDRLCVAEHFGTAKSFHAQRASLLAIQELPWKDVRPFLEGNVRSDLVGVYRAVRKQGVVYVAPPEASSITQYIDLDRHYD